MVLAVLAPLAWPEVRGENIDPDGDGSQYAYGENVGWLNAEPLGDLGPGLEVGEFAVTGFMWGENVGWVSFSCENTASCGSVSYGVTNDGGELGGWAWCENAGWLSLSCKNTDSCATASYGVFIDTATGEFSGRAWAENLGWVTFASAGVVPYGVKTAWTCSVPGAFDTLSLAKSGGDAELTWGALPGVAVWDVVRGGLSTLHASAGDFTAATVECLAENQPGMSVTHAGNPPAADAFWFLVRGGNCGGGSYDSTGTAQVAPRTGEIDAAAATCQ
jgi:hypothetical protein